MTIRPIRMQDIPAVLAIYKPFVEGTAITFEYETPSLDAFAKRVQGITGYFPWLVCEAGDGRIAGYAYASRQRERAAYQWNAEYSVYIDPAFHRRHIASALLDCLDKLLALQGFINVYSLVTQPNEKSMALHAARGFEIVAVYEETGFKLGEWLGVADLVKRLAPLPDVPAPTVPFHALPESTVRQILEEAARRLV